ncbi:hypothetical protein BGZ63DRAFT_419363 [Mariannaea sp. PMI_226]|nr:hypothetical protein BGZ63DRAFT_419363 [Mariannaea sp. PMI_226]
MAQSSQDPSWNLLSSLMAEYSFIVNCISFVCLGLGLMFLIPIALLIVLDLCIWLWRMYRSPAEPHESKFVESRTTDPKPTAIATGLDSPALRL